MSGIMVTRRPIALPYHAKALSRSQLETHTVYSVTTTVTHRTAIIRTRLWHY